MEIKATHATLGAIVRDVDLANVSDADFEHIESAWDTYAVLVFKDQHLTSAEQLAFSRRLGRLEKGLIKASDNLLAHISNTKRGGGLAGPESLQARFNKGNELWHTDSSYKRVAAKASLLSARAVPSEGGATEWADMRAGYDELDDAMQAWLADKVAVHSYQYSHAWHGGLELLSDEELQGLPPVEHRVVQIHPRTGRNNLFVGRHASHILGQDVDASRALLKQLTAQAALTPRTFKHQWEVGDLVLWDNRCVLHRGHPFPDDQPRDMVRTTVAGDAPDNEWASYA